MGGHSGITTPAIRTVHCWSSSERDTAGVLAWGRRLRAMDYQEVVDLQTSARTRALSVLAGWKQVRRPIRYPTRRRLLSRFPALGSTDGLRRG